MGVRGGVVREGSHTGFPFNGEFKCLHERMRSELFRLDVLKSETAFALNWTVEAFQTEICDNVAVLILSSCVG